MASPRISLVLACLALFASTVLLRAEEPRDFASEWISLPAAEVPGSPGGARESPDPAAAGARRGSPDPAAVDALGMGLLTPPPAPEEPSRDPSLSVTWSNGLVAKSDDDSFRVHIGGRLDFDNSWFAEDSNLLLGSSAGNSFHDGSLFRRARLRADGTMWGWIDFAAEVNFANIQDASNLSDQPVQIGSVGLTEFFLTFKYIPILGNIRVGHFKAPVGLERYSSSNAWYYMERSSLFDAFLGPNNYQDGVLVFNSFLDNRITAAAAATRIGPANIQPFGFGATDTASSFSARVSGLPIYEDDGRTLMHLGVGCQYQGLPNHEFEVASRPLIRSGSGNGTDTPDVVDTGGFFSPNGATAVDFEWATVCGPFSMSAEYAIAHATDIFDSFDGVNYTGPHGNVTYSAFYVESGLFVTPGDYRRYNQETGTWARTVPQHNAVVSKDGGWHGTGAVQLLVRFTYLDLVSGDPVLTPTSDTAGARAGRQSDVTLGVNWYLNPQTFIMANVVLSHIDSVVPGASGDFEAMGVRFHIDF